MEASVAASQTALLSWASIQWTLYPVLQRYLTIHVQYYSIHNNQEMDTAQMPTSWCMDNENLGDLHNERLSRS